MIIMDLIETPGTDGIRILISLLVKGKEIGIKIIITDTQAMNRIITIISIIIVIGLRIAIKKESIDTLEKTCQYVRNAQNLIYLTYY